MKWTESYHKLKNGSKKIKDKIGEKSRFYPFLVLVKNREKLEYNYICSVTVVKQFIPCNVLNSVIK